MSLSMRLDRSSATSAMGFIDLDGQPCMQITARGLVLTVELGEYELFAIERACIAIRGALDYQKRAQPGATEVTS